MATFRTRRRPTSSSSAKAACRTASPPSARARRITCHFASRPPDRPIMSRRVAITLGLLLLAAAALRALCFTGLQIGDDIVYSRIAVNRLHGIPDVTNTQGARTGFLLPIVACYALLGSGEVSLVLYNMLCSTALVGVLFLLARRLFGEPAGVPAALVAAVHPNLIRYASECHTDTPVAFWIAVALLVFL